MTGAERLKGWLAANGFSQNRFAKSIGVGSEVVSRWCSGIRTPNRKYSVVLRDTCGIDPSSWDEPCTPVQGDASDPVSKSDLAG